MQVVLVVPVPKAKAKLADDGRMADLMEPKQLAFDAKQMFLGGLKALVEAYAHPYRIDCGFPQENRSITTCSRHAEKRVERNLRAWNRSFAYFAGNRLA